MLKYLKRSPSTKGVSPSMDIAKDVPPNINHNETDQNVAITFSSIKSKELIYPSTNDDNEKTLPPLPPPSIITPDTNKQQTHLRKPKPLPYNHSSSSPPQHKTTKSKARSGLRPSTSSSVADAKGPARPFLNPVANASIASENWTAPEDADGAYIRRTYAHFDARGVRGDGLLEGKEWTRERGARAAWEASEDGFSGQQAHTRRLSLPSTTQAFGSNEEWKTLDHDNLPRSAQPYTQVGRLSPTPAIVIEKDQNISSTDDSTAAEVFTPENQTEDLGASSRTSDNLGPSTDVIAQPAFAASTSSLGSHSVESIVTPLRDDEKEERAAHHHMNDEEIDLERDGLKKKIDRYGFFPRDESQSNGNNNRSRATILSEASLTKVPKKRSLLHGHSRHGMGGRRKKGSTESRHASLTSQTSTDSNEEGEDAGVRWQEMQSIIQKRASKENALSEREAVRAGKWDRMLDVRRDTNGRPFFLLADGVYKSTKLKRRVYKGVPDRWRAAVWWALLQSRLPNETVGKLEADFAQLQRQPSPHDVQIDLDVPRTISGHILFHTRYGQGQRALFHVLHAFSLLCDQCGYCQGMGPIVATLLVYFPPEKAYAALVELHNDESFGIHQTFSPGFLGLVENFYVQRKIAMMLCPDVVQSLEEKNIVTSAYATKWYITLFTNVFPFSTQLRLWDAFFLHGRDVLVITSIAILWSLRETLLHGNFETCLSLLGREFIPSDDDVLMNWIYVVIQREDVRRSITMARKEWAQMVLKGETPIL